MRLSELCLSISLSDADNCDGSFEPTIVASLGYAGNQAQLTSVPPFAVTFVRKYFGNRISSAIHLYLCNEKSVLNIGHRVGPLPVPWIHCNILYYSGGDRLHHVLRYAETIHLEKGVYLIDAHTQQARRAASATPPFSSPSRARFAQCPRWMRG